MTLSDRTEEYLCNLQYVVVGLQSLINEVSPEDRLSDERIEAIKRAVDYVRKSMTIMGIVNDLR